MSISASSVSSSATNTTSTSNSSPGKMNNEDFLELLVIQLKNQDPTSPMDTAQFVSQLATLTTLQNSQTMSDSISSLVDNQNSDLSKQSSMIGKNIYWTNDLNEQNSVVSSVSIDGNEIVYNTESGDQIHQSDVTKVSSNN